MSAVVAAGAAAADAARPAAARARGGFLRRLRRSGRRAGRGRRYMLTGLLACTLCWALSLGYLRFAPRTYTSGFTLIMPGTGAGTSVDLPQVGQATSTSNSPFASPELSPTENYRKMLLSDRVRGAAADAASEPGTGFPVPRVDLADQTKLIAVRITGRSPGEASMRAQALLRAFQSLLDALRRDEIETRDASNRTMLAGYKAAVDTARERLIEFESEVGLVSADQYNTIVSQTERLRDMLREVDDKLADSQASTAELTRQLGITAEQANLAMVLRSDPVFQTLLDTLAKREAELAALTGTHGDRNDRVSDVQAERASTAARLAQRAAELAGRKLDVLRMRDLSITDSRARLFERLVGQLADVQALSATREKLQSQIAAEQARVVRLAPAASRLDDLRRDVQVAEAVFSSSLARIDTSKADYFASYPMVQVLERPAAPERPSSPLRSLALAGGLAANVLIILALVLAWLRTALLQRILKNG